MTRRVSKKPWYGASVLAALTVACSEPVLPGEETFCTQPGGEFAVYGCAKVTGRVTDTNGQPIADVVVMPVYFTLRCQCDTPLKRTAEDGTFTLTIHDYAGGLDSTSIYVRATFGRVIAKDSVLAVLYFAPIGEPAPVTSVAIELAI